MVVNQLYCRLFEALVMFLELMTCSFWLDNVLVNNYKFINTFSIDFGETLSNLERGLYAQIDKREKEREIHTYWDKSHIWVYNICKFSQELCCQFERYVLCQRLSN